MIKDSSKSNIKNYSLSNKTNLANSITIINDLAKSIGEFSNLLLTSQQNESKKKDKRNIIEKIPIETQDWSSINDLI
jgi:hypothetical protein